jgi:hypothetical protein
LSEKKYPQQKKERAKETFLMKLSTKPLKFIKMKAALMGGGGANTCHNHKCITYDLVTLGYVKDLNYGNKDYSEYGF